jgi:DNA-binding LytR/AlgR family response regulator
MASPSGRVLLHLDRDLRRVVEAANIYYLEAVGQTTLIRLRSSRTLRDVRSLGELVPLLSGFGVLRVHRNHAVNAGHVLEIRRRDAAADWEIKLEPPVARILPVSRPMLKRLWAAFGER